MIKTEPFDAAFYITSPDAQIEMLNDAFATGEDAYISQALGVVACARGMTLLVQPCREAELTREEPHADIHRNHL